MGKKGPELEVITNLWASSQFQVQPANQAAGRVVTKQRRPTGAVPPGDFIKPVPLKQAGRQATSPNLGARGAAKGAGVPSSRKPSAPNTGNVRKPSASAKPPGDAGKKPFSPSAIRKASEQQAASKVSPGTLRKPSAPKVGGKVSPSTMRKPSGQDAVGKVSPGTMRKPSGPQGPSGARKPSAGGASKPATGPTSKWR